ncbi:MAG: phosphodiester glycosidase family protein [Gaiella sp.]
MQRFVLAVVLALLSLAVAPLARGETRTLWPGTTFETGVQFTAAGPVAINVLRGPRPGGTTTLEPLLSNESLLGTETLTSMQRRLAPTVTTAGVNGDFFTLATGRPNGVLMRDGQLLSPPRGTRASAGITTDGTLDVRRVAFFGSWQGNGPKRPFNWFNEPPGRGGLALFTDAYGPVTPLIPGAVAAVLFPFPTAVPNVDLSAQVVEVIQQPGLVAIPGGGAVVVATGASAAALLAEALPGAPLTVRLTMRPDWPGVVAAIGGGPQIVRNGAPVFRAGEAFTSRQLGPRAPRTGIGQRGDGGIVLVAVDGRQRGWSVGLTNFELAQALVRLGAVTGMALDGGGSTTMAFDGHVLNRPSSGRERRIASALVLAYRGVFAPEPPALVSPNGDGVDDLPNLSYRLVRAATVKVRVLGPDGVAVVESSAALDPGSHPVALPESAPAPGLWRLQVEATDDIGQVSSIERQFVVDDTLGFLRVRKTLAVPPGGRELPVAWSLAREATVTVSVLDLRGLVVRTLVVKRYPAGDQTASWNGLTRGGLPVAAGRYTIRVVATGAIGRSELRADVVVRRV